MIILLVLILLYFACCLASFASQQTAKRVYVAAGVLLFIIAAFRPEGIDRDYTEYINHFNEYDFIAMLEPTFKAISWFAHTFLGSNYLFLFVVYAALGVSLKFVAIKDLSNVAILSVAIYISQFFILHEMTQIRAGVASGFLLLCIKPLYDRDWRRFLIFAACATAFHYSGIIIFLLWFISKDSRLGIYKYIIPVAILIFLAGIDVVSLIPIPFISSKIEVYKNIKEHTDSVHNEINVFNSVYLVRLALCYLLFWAAPTLTKHNKYYTLLLKMYVISLAALPLFASLPVVAYRIHELLGIVEIILIPTIVYLIKPVPVAYLAVCFYGLCQILLSLFYNHLLEP